MIANYSLWDHLRAMASEKRKSKALKVYGIPVSITYTHCLQKRYCTTLYAFFLIDYIVRVFIIDLRHMKMPKIASHAREVIVETSPTIG